ncbi:Transcriptional regulator [Bacillus pseudomycoides]
MSFLKKMSFLIERTFVLLYNDLIKQNEVRTGEESVFFETDL